MKKIQVNRRQLRRTIQAALTASFLATLPARAQFVYNSQPPADTVTVTSALGSRNKVLGSGTFSGYFHDAGEGSDMVLIDVGSAISNTTSVVEFGDAGGGGSLANRGKISDTGMAGSTPLVAVNLGTASSPLTATNNGTIRGNTTVSSSYAMALAAVSTESGTITVTNASGANLSSSGEIASSALVSDGQSGAIQIENQGDVTATSSMGHANGIDTTNAIGDIRITNTHDVSSSGYLGAAGIASAVSGSGATTVDNAGAISALSNSVYGQASALSLSSSTGDISITNSSSMTASAYNAYGVNVSGAGTVTLQNSGAITGLGKYKGGYSTVGNDKGVGFGVDITAAGNISITNTGSVSASASGYYIRNVGLSATSTSGSIYINNFRTVSVAATPYGSCISTSISAYTHGAAITIVQSGTLTASDDAGSNDIEVVTSESGAVGAVGTVTNTGSIVAEANLSEESGGIYFASKLLTAKITNGIGGTISAPTMDSGYGILVLGTVGNDEITNQGSITSGGVGINDAGTGNVTINDIGGAILAPNGAILLGSGSNIVNISGNPTIVGLINGGINSTKNTLSFSGMQATLAQRKHFETVSNEAASDPSGQYQVAVGSATYTFTNFANVKATFSSGAGR